MADDPYSLLGVAKTASAADITKAYRKLAKKLHPDLNPGDKAAEENFKQITAAYDIIGDEEKRGRYDRGEIDAGGQERPKQRYYREYAGGEEGARYRSTASPRSGSAPPSSSPRVDPSLAGRRVISQIHGAICHSRASGNPVTTEGLVYEDRGTWIARSSRAMTMARSSFSPLSSDC